MPTLIAYHTGMRMGEVPGLSWSAVDLENGRIEVRRSCSLLRDGQPVFKEPKTRAGRRSVEIGRTLVEALRKHRVAQVEKRLRLGREWGNQFDLVCCLEDGKCIRPAVLGTRFTRCLDRTGECGSFHGLRRTHVSLLIRAGIPINTISARVGHANPSITHNIFAHLLPGMNRMAADAFETLVGESPAMANLL
ncbi:MAG: site-specific integrase [Chloroflexota bacterium]